MHGCFECMSRPKRIYQSAFPYHVYNRTNNAEFLFNLNLEIVFPIFMRSLKYVSHRMNLKPHHFILMSNHYHLIASTPESNLDQCMQVFQTLISKEINYLRERTNHVFGNRYKATVISTDLYLNNAIRYLYQNPLRSGMVSSIFDYRYSTLHAYMHAVWQESGLHLDAMMAEILPEKRAAFLRDLCASHLSDDDTDNLRKQLRKVTVTLMKN